MMLLKHAAFPLRMLLCLQLLMLKLRRDVLLEQRHLRLLRHFPLLKLRWIMPIALVMMLTAFLCRVLHLLNLESLSVSKNYDE